MKKKFWILWNPKGNTPPTVRFNNLEAARKTAAEMQIRIGEGTMFVMESVAGITISRVMKWEK